MTNSHYFDSVSVTEAFKKGYQTVISDYGILKSLP